ncbi:MAG: hypothetical protein WBP11_09050 [Dokdonella sp.]
MSMGLLDLPGMAFDVVEAGLIALSLPAWLRILFWSVISGAAGMWLYRRYSPQSRIAEVRTQIAAAQSELAKYDGEFDGLMPLIGRQFRLVFTQMRLTLGATLLAGLPILLMLPWLSNQYSHALPSAGTFVTFCAEPEQAIARLRADIELERSKQGLGCRIIAWPTSASAIVLRDEKQDLLTLPIKHAVPVIHQKEWWNAFIGNPLGYLPEQSTIRSLQMDLPERNIIARGPAWMRGWEFCYFVGVLAVSLWLRWRWKLQ